MKPLVALLLVFLAAAASAQGAYRWVGKDGKVHYSDVEPSPAEVQKVEKKTLRASVVDSGGKLSYEMREAAAKFPVTLYIGADCSASCTKAREFLGKRGIPYAEKAIVTPEDGAAFKKATGSEVVPTLFAGGKAEAGFEETAWASLLETLGYR
ncbi:MAG: glutaredoxin family protein [Rhodocyclales bacterium]|nr:glutaredoxin family protein [Rhodocyclales bacterium]